MPWYASRATGVIALLLMTAVVLLGLLVARNGKLPGMPRFAVTGLHRNLSLTAVAFVALHVLTAIADSYVSIPLTATFILLDFSRHGDAGRGLVLIFFAVRYRRLGRLDLLAGCVR